MLQLCVMTLKMVSLLISKLEKCESITAIN